MRKLLRRVHYWLRQRRSDADLAEELEFHRAMTQKRLEESGLAPGEAARESQRTLGNLTLAREDARAVWLWPWLESLWQDARHGARALAREPGFSLVAILTLALGIGANTAIFSVVETVLLRPLPGADPSRLVLLWETSAQLPTMMVSYPDFLDWRKEPGAFSDIGVFNQFHSMTIVGGESPERVRVALVSANLGRLTGLEPVLGRGFNAEDDRPGGTRAAILSHGFWKQRFGGDPQVLGRRLILDNEPYVVVGVLAERADHAPYPRGAALWLPYGLFVDKDALSRGNHPGLLGIARLKPGVDLQQARTVMTTVAARLAKEYPATNTGIGVSVTPLLEARVGSFRPTLFLLVAAVVLVLLVVCANVTNLLLVRSAGRQREFAMRAALGASRTRLLRQTVTEQLVLSLAAAAVGVGIAHGMTGLLRAIGRDLIPRSAELVVDGPALAFALGLAIVVGLVVASLPGFFAGRRDAQATLRQGHPRSDSRGGRRVRDGLVVAEVSISLVLAVGATLLVRSLVDLQNQSPGFSTERVITGRINPPALRYGDEVALAGLGARLVERVGAVPGVESAAAVSPLPFSDDGWQAGITVEGVPEPTPDDNPLVDASSVSPDYFRVMRIPLLRGRVCSLQDTAEASPVVLVNQAFVDRFWPAVNPLGRHIHMGPASADAPWRTVVGVVGNVKHSELQVPASPEVYFPLAQQPQRSLALVVRTTNDPGLIVPSLRRAVAAVDDTLPLYGVTTTGALVDESLGRPRLSTWLLGLLAALALVLAVVGVYGVTSYTVGQRTRELGIRTALGAQRGDIFRLVLGHGLRVIAVGVSLGLVAAVGLTRFLASQLFGITPNDPLTIALASIALSVAVVAACLVPARRAAGADPMAALRCE